MGKPQLDKSEVTDRQVSSSTKCNSKQTVEKSNEYPEWLPEGWSVDFRTRKSGANMGHGYKCYIDPSGHKFYSKPEVLRYLETVNRNSCTSKKDEICKNNDVVEKSTMEDSTPGWRTEVNSRKGGDENRKDPDAVEKSSVDDLPSGWIMEVKLRKGGNSKKKKDLFFIDPVSGYVFRSKKDALRYLKSGDISSCVLKPHKRQIQDEDNITPSSNVKKQKLKQSATKRQLFVDQEMYDEITLELPDTNNSKKGQDVTVSSGIMVVKNQSLENAAVYTPGIRKHLIQNLKKEFSAEAGFHLNPTDNVQEKNHVKVLENASKKNHSNCNLSITKESNVAHRFSRRLAGAEPEQLTNVTNEQTLQVPKRNLRKNRTVSDTDLSHKSFEQLNGVLEVEHSHKMQREVLLKKISMHSEGQAGFREHPHQVETDKIEDNKPEQDSLKLARKTTKPDLPSIDNPHSSDGLASEAHVLKEKKLHANGTGKGGLQEIYLNSNKSSNKKEHQIPSRASKRLAGVEHELMSNSISNKRAPEYKSKKSKGEINATLQQSEGQPAMELTDHALSINGESSNKSIKPLEAPSITKNQLKKLGDEEVNNDDKSEPQQSFAFHYSWSDPCLEFAIQTLTGALPVEDSVGNGPTRIPETDMVPKIQLVENVTGSRNDKKSCVNSKKSKKKKGLSMPRRLSKRLAGDEPEVLPAERAIEYATRKSCNDKPAATVILTNGVSGPVHVKEESKLTVHASDRLKTLCGESSTQNKKSYDTQTVPNEQLQRFGAENVDDDRSDPQFPSPFGDSWSDPCLEFAIRTFTGALPVDDAAAAGILPVMTPDVTDQPNKDLLDREQKSINEEAHDNPKKSPAKKEFNTVYLPMRQLLNQPELRTCSTSYGNYPKFASRESHRTRNFNGRETQHVEAGHARQIDLNTVILEEPSKEKQVLEGESVAEKLQPEIINHDNSERAFCVSFMDSWSDPCLEFAFKTLTGTIPVEENISIQGCFQKPANHHNQGDDGSTLPEFGLSSISQSGISFQNDIGERSKPWQQSSTISSLLPQEKPSLHDFSGVDPQKHKFQYSNDFQRR